MQTIPQTENNRQKFQIRLIGNLEEYDIYAAKLPAPVNVFCYDSDIFVNNALSKSEQMFHISKLIERIEGKTFLPAFDGVPFISEVVQ